MATESYSQHRQYRNPLGLMEYWSDAAFTLSTDVGPFKVGDIIWNTAPSTSTAFAWVCTTAGATGATAVFSAVILPAGVTATAAEINKLAGNAVTAADFTKLHATLAVIANAAAAHALIADATDANSCPAVVNAILVALKAFGIVAAA